MSRFQPSGLHALSLIVYLCPNCGQDTACTEREKPHCYCCGAHDLIELHREALTPASLSDRMRLCADRIVENLEDAYADLQENKPVDPAEEEMLLEALVEAQQHQHTVHEFADTLCAHEGEHSTGGQ